jgi:membrane fusion protein (multidrug efflux system)
MRSAFVMPLSSGINGQIQEVRVIEGQLVHAGDVLVVVDPKDYKVAVDQAKANLAEAEASAAGSIWSVPVTTATAWSGLDSAQTAVYNTEAGVHAVEQTLEGAKAALQQAQANADKTDEELIEDEVWEAQILFFRTRKGS